MHGVGGDSFINHGGSLFPRPLPPCTPRAHVDAVCERFRFLGRLTAKACRDYFIVPLPLSTHFLHLVRGGTLSHAAFPAAGATGGVASGYASLAAALAAVDAQQLPPAEARRRYEDIGAAEFSQARLRMGVRLSFGEWCAAGGCTFTCPVSGAPLCAGGDARPLTVHNLQEYTHLLAQLWLADGAAQQAAAFREGLEEVFPPSALAPFSLTELQTLLCGTMTIEWSEGELQRHIHPTGGYTKHSKVPPPVEDATSAMHPAPTGLALLVAARLTASLYTVYHARTAYRALTTGQVYQLLLDELQRMGNGERRNFLNFVTACPHLPPVGLSMLEIEVRMPTTTTHASCDSYLPRMHTRRCALRLAARAPHPLVPLSAQVIPQQHGAYPTAQTCGNKLCLPEYDSPEALRSGLAEAFANADYGGLHEVGGLH